MNYGFIQPDITPEDWKFGARSDKTVLQPDGQWDVYLPTFEPQAHIYETSGCTVWGSQNQIETLLKKLFNIDANYSERYTYILAGVTLNGASPQNAYESIRKQGVIPDAELPYAESYAEFLTPQPMKKKYLNMGRLWLDDWEFNHEWVVSRTDNIKEKIAEALQYSPVAVSVTAWYKENGLYVDKGLPNTHWCLCYGYEKVGDKYRLKIFDSYDKSHKLLHEDHFINVAKRITIKRRETPIKTNWLIDLWCRLTPFC